MRSEGILHEMRDKKDRRQAGVKGIAQGEKGLASEVPFPLMK